MGNKQRIADEILKTIFENCKSTVFFVDLFCGSCSIIERVPDSYLKIANDKNIYLIEMFYHLVHTDMLFPRTIEKETYNYYRDLYNKHRKGTIKLTEKELAMVGWIGWMGSFNGRFYSGGYSGHNVLSKNGKSRDYITEQINNTTKSINKLKSVLFQSEDYEKVSIPEKSIVYCDIPYYNTKQYESSKDFDYERFYNWCRENKNKYQIFVSEYQMPEDFKCIWQKEVTNSMNQTKTYKPIEKLFVI